MAKKKNRGRSGPLKSEVLFPGPRYLPQLRQGYPTLKAVGLLAVELGPDHPKVKMLRKDIADRKRSEPTPYPVKK